MAARKAAQGLKGHPMEQKAIEALLDGQSVRKVSAWLVPYVCPAAVQRYRTHVVRPTMRNAEAIKAVIPEELTRKNGTDAQQTDSDTQVRRFTTRAILAAPAIHIRENRLRLQQQITDRLLTVVNERADDMSVCESCRRLEKDHPWEEITPSFDKDGNLTELRAGCSKYVKVPGGETGLVIRKLKPTGYEYAVDTPLLAEIREHEKHVAIELGQWQENAGNGAVSIQIVCPTAPGEQPRVTFASQDQIEATPEVPEIAEIGLIQK